MTLAEHERRLRALEDAVLALLTQHGDGSPPWFVADEACGQVFTALRAAIEKARQP